MVNYEETDAAIQKRIKTAFLRYRLAKGWSQERMAQFLGTTKAIYQKMENSLANPQEKRRDVPIPVLMRFCENIGTTMEQVVKAPGRLRA